MITEPRIDVEHTNTTMVRLDLRNAEGRTTVGRIRQWLSECQDNGAHDDTPVVIVALSGLLGGAYFQPIIGAHIDHRRQTPTEPVAAEERS